MPVDEQGVSISRHRYQLIPRVLCFVFHGDEVLLLRGAPDKKIWAGKYNGLGGHVERGETVHAAAAREIREEAGLAADQLRLRGVVTIETGEATGIGLYVFTAKASDRATRPSTEGGLEWVPVASVSELDCVEDLPTLLARLRNMDDSTPPFGAHYHYDQGGHLVIAFDDGMGGSARSG